ncbi:MAG: hypothetical protein AAGD06_30890 [Acidobacteriota bacterium]
MSPYRFAPARGWLIVVGLMVACLVGLAIPFWPLWLDPQLVLSFNDGNIERTLSPIFSYPGSLTRVWNDHFFFGRGESGMGISGWSLLETVLGPHAYRRHSPVLAMMAVCLATYWTCRQMARSRAAASVAAVFAAFCGWTATASLSGLVGRPLSLAWAMLAVGLLERTARRGGGPISQLLGHVLAGAAVGLAVSEIADVGAFFALAVAAWWLLATRSWTELWPRRWRQGLLIGVLVATSAVVAGHTLHKMVSTELAVSIAEDRSSEESWDWATQWSLPAVETWSLIVPDFHGASSRSETSPYWGKLGRTPSLDEGGTSGWRHFKLNGYGVGTVAALLALFLFVEARRRDGPLPAPERRRALVALGLVTVSLMLAWGRFFVAYRALHALPYLDGIRNPEKWLGPMSLFLAVAVAYAVDLAIDRGRDLGLRWGRRLDVACLLLAILCVFALGWVPPADGLTPEAHAQAARAARVATLGALAVLGALAFGWRLLRRVPEGRRPAAVAWGLGTVLSAQLVLAVGPYVETTDYAYLRGPSPLGEALDTLGPPGRLKLLPPRDGVLNNWRQTYLASRALPLFDPISIRAMPGEEQRLFDALQSRPLDLWRIAGIRWFLCTPEALAELLQLDGDFVVRGQRPAAEWDPRLAEGSSGGVLRAPGQGQRTISLVEWRGADAPLQLAPTWRQVEDSETADAALLTRFRDPAFPVDGEPIVHVPAGFEPPVAEDAAPTLEILDESPTRLEVATQGAGMLVRASRFDRRWRVTLDGEDTPLLRANLLFQAVAVPPGEHRIVFEFAPHQGLFIGSILSRLALLALAWIWLRRTAPRSAPSPLAMEAP